MNKLIYVVLSVLALIFVFLIYNDFSTVIHNYDNDLSQPVIVDDEAERSFILEIHSKSSQAQTIPIEIAQEIMQLSLEYAQCKEDILLAENYPKEYRDLLLERLSQLSVDDQVSSLNYLLKVGAITELYVSEVYEKINYKSWRNKVPLFSGEGDLNGIPNEDLSQVYTDFNNIILNRSYEDLLDWIESNPEIANFSFESSVISSPRTTIVSPAGVIALHLENISESTKTRLAELLNFEIESIVVALKAGISNKAFDELLGLHRQTGDFRRTFYEQNAFGKYESGNLLSAVLLYGTFDNLQSLISEFQIREIENNPFITPAINRFLAKKIQKKELNLDDELKIRKLNDISLSAKLFPQGELYHPHLFGVPNQILTNEDVNWIKSLGVEVTNNIINSLEGDVSVVDPVIIQSSKIFINDVKILVSRRESCNEILQRRDAREPDFQSPRDILPLIYDVSLGVNDVKKLYDLMESQSPVLYESFVHSLLYWNRFLDVTGTLATKDYSQTSAALLEDKESYFPHEQNAIAAKVCMGGRINELAHMLESGWFIDIYSPVFSACKERFESINSVYIEAMQSDDASPSPIYELVLQRDYQGAYEAVVAGRTLHGKFGFGRDTLGLLLDQLVPFNVEITQSQKRLLFSLLDRAKSIEDYHHRRFNRLRLKDPQLVEEIEIMYPHFSFNERLGLSRYRL